MMEEGGDNIAVETVYQRTGFRSGEDLEICPVALDAVY